MVGLRAGRWRARIAAALLTAPGILALSTGPAVSAAKAVAERVSVTGEIIDSWCYLTEIMYAEGSAHHQCAVWCAAGGIPVGILADDGTVYIVLKVGEDDRSVAQPRIMEIQTHRVTVDGDLIRRDGNNYLLVSAVVSDEGIVNPSHEDYGIQPFGE